MYNGPPSRPKDPKGLSWVPLLPLRGNGGGSIEGGSRGTCECRV